MARSITLTLGAGLGADLGPNFNLTANVGSVTPSTATKTELLAGKSVIVDDLATQVTVTSTGNCTNAITQTIPCVGQTTTSTSTTTTTAGPTCRQFVTYTNGNAGDGGVLEYYNCSNVYQTISVDNSSGNLYFCALSGTVNQISGTGVNWSDQGPCTETTTTTTYGPTTTTTAGTTVDIYINNTNSLDIPITGMTINGVAVTYFSGVDFPIAAGNNGSFTSTQIGTYTVDIYYGGHIPGQNILFTDSNNTISCQNINGSAGSFTINNAVITAGTQINVIGADGACA